MEALVIAENPTDSLATWKTGLTIYCLNTKYHQTQCRSYEAASNILDRYLHLRLEQEGYQGEHDYYAKKGRLQVRDEVELIEQQGFHIRV